MESWGNRCQNKEFILCSIRYNTLTLQNRHFIHSIQMLQVIGIFGYNFMAKTSEFMYIKNRDNAE